MADAEVAVIEMENPAYGKIVIELYPNIAPKMVERFKQLIKEGFYNGTTFHRIDPKLGIIQGGDPLSKDNNPDNDGTGDSPYPNVPGEYSDIPFERGIVGALPVAALLGMWALWLIRRRPRVTDGEHDWLLWAAAASAWLVTVMVGMVNTTLHDEHGLLAALLLGLWLPRSDRR